MTTETQPRIAILGAGPIGLEAALAAAERGWEFTVYEAGGSVGANVRDWGHVRLFTPWEMNVSPRARRALLAGPGGSELPRGDELAGGGDVPGGSGVPDGGGVPSGSELPSGAELVERLLEPLAALPALAGRVRLGTRVEAVAREGLLKHEAIGSAERGAPPVRLLLSGDAGPEAVEHAKVVSDWAGTYGSP